MYVGIHQVKVEGFENYQKYFLSIKVFINGTAWSINGDQPPAWSLPCSEDQVCTVIPLVIQCLKHGTNYVNVLLLFFQTQSSSCYASFKDTSSGIVDINVCCL